MTAIETARAALAAAEQLHAAKLAETAERAALLVEVEASYGDAPSPDLAGLVREATEARRLATLETEGAARKVEAARAALLAAEREALHAALAAALPRAEREALFDDLGGAIETIARCDAIPAVNIHEPATLVELELLLTEQHRRTIARAIAARMVRQTIAEQHAAVETVRRTCAALGRKIPDVAPIPEALIYAAAKMEAHLMGAASVDETFWSGWLQEVDLAMGIPHFVDRTFYNLCRETPQGFHSTPLAASIERMAAWGRMSLRTGDRGRARATVIRQFETPRERASREEHERNLKAMNEREAAAMRRTADSIFQRGRSVEAIEQAPPPGYSTAGYGNAPPRAPFPAPAGYRPEALAIP